MAVKPFNQKSNDQVYVIEYVNDMEFLRMLMLRLYREERLTGDNQRDLAQRLQVLLERAVELVDGIEGG